MRFPSSPPPEGLNPLANMAAFQKRLGSFFVGWYVWILAVSFGMVLLDIFYSNLVPEATFAFSKVSDFLLFIGFVTLLSAMVAIAFAWETKTARNLLIASLVVILFEFLIPAFFSQFIQNTQALTTGAWLRTLPGGAASILAFIGMYQFNW
jgi:hypothetical protein